MIKVSAVASRLDTRSAREMVEALIAGERDPRVLAGLARGRMRAKHAALLEALTRRFDAHHGELARMTPIRPNRPPISSWTWPH